MKHLLPKDGLLKWTKAWLGYFKWAAKRRIRLALAFASNHGGFDGFKYLWGAPAAASVIALAFGIVMLDERLGLRKIIVSSPPANWIADLVGIEQESEPLAKTKLENAGIERLAARSSRQAVQTQPEMPQSDDSAATAKPEEPLQIALEETGTVSDPAPAPVQPPVATVPPDSVAPPLVLTCRSLQRWSRRAAGD